MKKYILACLFFGATSVSVMAADAQQAPADVLNELVATCKSWAVEDQVPEAEREAYVLQCVNDELNSLGYAPVEKID